VEADSRRGGTEHRGMIMGPTSEEKGDTEATNPALEGCLEERGEGCKGEKRNGIAPIKSGNDR